MRFAATTVFAIFLLVATCHGTLWNLDGDLELNALDAENGIAAEEDRRMLSNIDESDDEIENDEHISVVERQNNNQAMERLKNAIRMLRNVFSNERKKQLRRILKTLLKSSRFNKEPFKSVLKKI